ncbi:GntR family transcriptional regulator, partial [Actinomyces sp.]
MGACQQCAKEQQVTNISPPVYEQIAQAIRRQILDGDLPPGSRLPSESILCERFSVTR